MINRWIWTLLLLTSYINATLYEDGTNYDDWSIYDGDESVTLIGNIYDDEQKSMVITLDGDGVNSAYRIGNYKNHSNAWANHDDKIISWSMKYSENFTVYVLVSTKDGGVTYLYYRPSNLNKQASSGNILHGLGTDAKNGTWQRFTRDLNADLKDFEPDNEISSIEGIIIRGSGRVDNIQTVSENMPIFIIGASTVKKINYEGIQGWGDRLADYSKNPENIYNRARAGSVAGQYGDNYRSYNLPNSYPNWFSDHDWGKTKEEMSDMNITDGGFLLIQFGSNEKRIPATDAEYKQRLKEYIHQARDLGFTPVLITVPGARDNYSLTHNLGRELHYIDTKRELAEEESVLLLDLYQKTVEDFNNSTEERLGYRFGNFTYTDHGEFDHIDYVHYEPRGAKRVAGWIRDMACEQRFERLDANMLCQQFDNTIVTSAKTVYSTAEFVDNPSDSNIDGWRILGEPDKLNLITRVESQERDGYVIHLAGDGNNFLIHGSQGDNSKSWNNTEQKNIEWSMNFDDIRVYVYVETTNGSRTMFYEDADEDRGLHPTRPSIRYGLGSDTTNSWHTFHRNLEEDLKKFEPDNSIVRVKGFALYGTGEIDDLKMY